MQCAPDHCFGCDPVCSKNCGNKNNLQSPAMVNHGGGDAAAEGMATTFTGTMRYMSPERLHGNPYSWPADIWCAGMILLELAMGDHPYKVCFASDAGPTGEGSVPHNPSAPLLPPLLGSALSCRRCRRGGRLWGDGCS